MKNYCSNYLLWTFILYKISKFNNIYIIFSSTLFSDQSGILPDIYADILLLPYKNEKNILLLQS